MVFQCKEKKILRKEIPVSMLVSFVLHVRRQSLKYQYHASDIIATGETPVSSDMVSDTTVAITGTNAVTAKSTGFEKYNVSVCLTKLPPIIAFKNAKREVNAMGKKFNEFRVDSG